VKERKGKDKTRHKGVDDLQTLTKLLKSKHKKHKVYNAESDDSDVFNDDEDEDYENENITALLKNVISKIPEFDWVADSGAFSHMTD